MLKRHAQTSFFFQQIIYIVISTALEEPEKCVSHKEHRTSARAPHLVWSVEVQHKVS